MVWMSRKAVPLAISRMRGRDEEEGSADESAHLAAAEELLGTLGDLKGLALKLGQTISYMDGALPAAAEPVYRKVLSKLQAKAPSLDWEAAQAVLTEELGDIGEHFSSIAEEPFAAASIGQVHRARLLDGTEVAVKIQYPGIRDAVKADLANLDSVKALARPMLGMLGAGQNVDFAADTLAEIRARLEEELDYEHEARMQVRFFELFAGDPDIIVPEVFVEHCTGRVLTTRFVRGRTLDDIAEHEDQAAKDRWGHTLTRAVTAQLYAHRLFNGDPHPGNYLFVDGGKVVLLDFGCVKEISEAMSAKMRRYVRAAIVATQTDTAEDWAEYEAAVGDALRLDEGDAEVAAFYREYLLFILEPVLADEPFAFTPDFVARSNDLLLARKRELIFGKGKMPRGPKLPPMPAGYTIINRLQWGFYSVLTRLRANVNWNSVLPEDMRH